MPLWTGATAGCFWSYHTGQLIDAEWDRFVGDVEKYLSRHAAQGTSCTVVTIAHDASPPSAKQRKALANVIASERATAIRAHAMVTNSALIRGVLKALDWIVSKPYPERVFADPIEAIHWCQQVLPTTTARAVVAEIVEQVPKGHLHLALRRREAV